MSYGLSKISHIDEQVKTNLYYKLLKLAMIDPSRRGFLLSAAGAMVGTGQVKPTAIGKKALGGYGQALNHAAGLGMEAIPTKILKGISGLNKHLNDIASARLYRMNRVAGDNKGQAMAKVIAARKKRALELKLTRPYKMGQDVASLEKIKGVGDIKVDGMDSFREAGKKIKESAQAGLSLRRRLIS